MQKIESRDREICTAFNDICPVCNGTGWENIEQDASDLYGPGGKVNAVRPCTACNGGHAQKVSDALNRAEIPNDKSYSNFDWSIYPGEDLTRQKAIIDGFLKHFEDMKFAGLGLYITSKMKGSGKTFLAESIAAELIKRFAVSTRFVRSSDLLDICESKHDDNQDPLDDIINCRVLILDDLGQKRTGRDWMADVLFKIIDARYRMQEKTIITSNVPLPDLDLDERIIDRLNRMTITIKLPEYCVRAREANTLKQDFLRTIGIEL